MKDSSSTPSSPIEIHMVLNLGCFRGSSAGSARASPRNLTIGRNRSIMTGCKHLGRPTSSKRSRGPSCRDSKLFVRLASPYHFFFFYRGTCPALMRIFTGLAYHLVGRWPGLTLDHPIPPSFHRHLGIAEPRDCGLWHGAPTCED